MNDNTDISSINRLFGNADLFLVDRILKGLFKEGTTLLDAGCGEGRNLSYFLKNNYTVFGIDQNPSGLRMLKFAASSMIPGFVSDNFIEGDLQNLPFPNNHFDYILCLSVLHFAKSESQFSRILENLTKTLKSDGILLIGMNSVFGLDNEIKRLENGLYQVPGGESRLLLNDEIIDNMPVQFELELSEPIKTISILHQESNSYMVLKKILHHPAT